MTVDSGASCVFAVFRFGVLTYIATSASAFEVLRWDAESIVDDPYVINELDIITFHATSLADAPLTVRDVLPNCTCVAYMPGAAQPLVVNPSGHLTLKFLVVHERQPETAMRFISVQPSSQAAPKMLKLEIHTPVAPTLHPNHLDWTLRVDTDKWRYVEVTPCEGHPEYHVLRLLADDKVSETSLEDLKDADGHSIPGGSRIGIRPTKTAGFGRYQVNAIVSTSAGERALRIQLAITEKSDAQVTGEF
jgi:hypothetical protein